MAACTCLLISACGGTTTDEGPKVGTTDTDTDTTTDTDPTTDTDAPEYFDQDLGSLMLVRRNNGLNNASFLYGLFVDEHPGFQNLAECAVDRSVCIDQLPVDEDTYVEPNMDLLFDPQFSEYRYVGLTVSLGGYEANYFNGQVSYYYADLTDQTGGNPISGPLGAEFGVEWGDYKGSDDIMVSNDIELQYPRPGSKVSFHDGENVLIEWVPNNEGEIYLTVKAGINFYRMYLLEDDGYFELNVDDLGFGSDGYDVEFKLSRWNRGQVEHQGHTLDLVATSEVTFSGEYFYVGGRTEIELANTCGEATTAPVTLSGQYWGRLKNWGFTDAIDPTTNPSCTGFFARGEEGLFHIQLEPLQNLTAEYILLDDDASIYLLEDCTDVQTCLTGADLTLEGAAEFLSYFNDSDEVVDLYLVVDGYLSTNGVFYADLTIDQVLEPDMYNQCPDAMQQPTPTGPGTYFTSYLPYTNQLDPGAGGCTNSSQVGPDSMTQVQVDAGQTLTVNINMTNGDPAIYLLYNCTNALSCAVGSDASVGQQEMLAYTNNSGVSELVYLVIDSKTTLRPYFLTIDIQ
jgi:hypothetical protein